MEKKSVELADIFRSYGDQYRSRYRLSPQQSKVMNLIRICRTAALGGHMQQCDHCGYQQPAYNSCRNRHCPKCQSAAKQKWLNARSSELLPCGYFHLVFTLPHGLNALILTNKKLLLDALFAAVNQVLQCFASDRQWRLHGRIGFVGIVHTWSQTLMDHFHLHCLVPAGALQPDSLGWVPARKRYLFSQRAMAKAFKHRYLQKLCALYETDKLVFAGRSCELAGAQGFGKLVAQLKKKHWIVYAKRPFAGPQQVLDYLGRYTHRVAISNYRIVSCENGRVTFTWRDRSDEDKIKHMTLDAVEFIRRFLLHVLPDRFVKIRYFGFLAHRNRKKSIALIRGLLDPGNEPVPIRQETVAEMMLRVTGIDITLCPHCGKGRLRCSHRIITRARDPTSQAVVWQ